MTIAINTAPESAETRQHTRIGVELEVTLESESNFYAGFSMNISEGGLFIATYDVQPVGSEIKISLALGDDEPPITAYGLVRWVREYNPASPDTSPGMGVQFTRMSREDVMRIYRFCAERRDPLFYED
ncbi:MAG: hypothetical protein CMH57_09910 [Myxococcales bacterium]|nr:hypothetical protein [Myxococcales bacterium]